MNFRLSFLILLFGLHCLGQNSSELENYGLDNYDWQKLLSVTIQTDDGAHYFSDDQMIAELENKTKRQQCGNIRKWKSAFATLPYGPDKDIAIEKTYILFCEFENGLKIPFRYFPQQYAIYDMRNEFHYFYTFPEMNNRMRNVVNECIKAFENLN